LAGTESALHRHPNFYKLVYLAAFLLILLTYVVENLVTILSTIRTVSLPPNTEGMQVAQLMVSTTYLILWPVVPFFVFYMIGPMLENQSTSSYLRVITSSFIGSALGSIVGLLATVGLNGVVYSDYNLFTPGTDVVLWSANFGTTVVRDAIDFAFIAFAGIALGKMRRTQPGVVSAEEGEASQAVLKDSPQPHVETALGLLTTNPPPISFSAL
jgi:hypothetical protein